MKTMLLEWSGEECTQRGCTRGTEFAGQGVKMRGTRREEIRGTKRCAVCDAFAPPDRIDQWASGSESSEKREAILTSADDENSMGAPIQDGRDGYGHGGKIKSEGANTST